MKKSIYILTLMLMCAFTGYAQSVSVVAEIDSVQRLIGEQARIKIKVSYDAGKRLVMPTFDKQIVDGIEIVEAIKPDTQQLNDGKRLTVTNEYVVTSFDSALYVIPPFEVLVEGEPHYSQELAMAVYCFPVDTTNAEQFFGPKDVWQVPLEWRDVQSSVVSFVLLLLFTAALVWVIVRYRNNKPIIRIVKVKPKLPAHIVALNEIERLKASGEWRTSGNSKEYYTHLTDALRVYLSERFGFSAIEMTTAEIVDNLLKIKDKESIQELQELLTMADLVKFAKFNPPMNENDRNLLNAIEFINSTKPEGVEENPQPTEKKIINQRSAKAKRMLLFAIVLLTIVTLALLVIFILDIYYLLS